MHLSAPALRLTTRLAVALALAAALTPAAARAQLRPLEPLPAEIFDQGRTFAIHAGAGILLDQPAKLAGTVGRLLEIGDYHAAWRSGRIAVEIQGTAFRDFRDHTRVAAPDPAVRTPGPRRSDSGDHAISTIVRLTPEAPSFAALRFGTRLPNSNNRIGLDRDRTDFFATLGGQLRRGRFRAAAETGLGIFGTRLPDYEQSDVLLYSATVRRDGPVTAVASVTGHYTPHRVPRGNEDLSETRVGLQIGRQVLLRALWVHGLSSASPSNGLLVSVGTLR